MGIANLRSAIAKICRAKEHHEALYNEIRTLESETNLFRVAFGREEDWHVIYIDPVPAVPLRIALIAGDCLNNARAALDHLVWELVLREDQQPTQINCFPLCETSKEFEDNVKPSAKKGKRSPLQGIPVNGDAWTLIERAQPFNDSQQQTNPLLYLRKLTNIDKHRTILFQRTFLDPQKLLKVINWDPGLQPIEQKVGVFPLSSERQTEIARFCFPSGTDPNRGIKGKLSLEPSIGEGTTQVSMSMLTLLIQQVANILKQVEALPRVES